MARSAWRLADAAVLTRLLAAALALAFAAGASAQHVAEPPVQPEAATAISTKPGWTGSRFAVAAANPLATEAGYEILRAGGSALDAAIAVQMVLALVEPQSSGIGGGALLLHFDGRGVQAYDGRETAPAAADERLFLDAEGKPLPFMAALVGGRSVGVPGAVRMLEMAHREHGKLPWARLFERAIALAENGFAVSPRLHGQLASDTHLRKDPVAAAYFYRADGSPRAVGETLRNPDLAAVLQRIAAEGSGALHEGRVAQAIVAKVRGHAANPGKLSEADLAGYRPVKRAPLCHEYEAAPRAYLLCGFPPPSSGAITIGQILGMASFAGAGRLPMLGAEWLHRYMEASRLAFADRDRYIADPAFARAPGGDWMTMLQPGYLASRAARIDPAPGSPRMPTAPAGMPATVVTHFAPMPAQLEHGTSHISVIDAEGRALSLTTTIESQFGSRQMVNVTGAPGGFLLNNELTDFSFLPADAQGRPIANRVEPGKRPRSSMAPTLVFDKATGKLVMSAGSPGGALIIHFTAKTLYGVLHAGLDPQRAIDLPNFATLGGPVLLEKGRFSPEVAADLRARGHEVRETELTSGIQALQVMPRGWAGGADPRREGVVGGD